MKDKWSAEEYRDWLIGNLHRFGHDELIALICPIGEDANVKAMLDRMDKVAIEPTINKTGEVCCGDCRFQLPILYVGSGDYFRKKRSKFCCQCGRVVKWE